MESKIYNPPHFTKNRWFRLGVSVVSAFGFALVLLLIPLAAQNQPQPARFPWLHHLPLGPEIVYATGGLTITKTANPTPTVNHGGLVTYSLLIQNNTGFNLNGIDVTDTVPANTTCADLPPAPSGWFAESLTDCQTDQEARWVLPTGFGRVLTNGTSVILTYVVSVDEPLPDLFEVSNAALSYGVSAISPTTFTDSGAQTITTTVYAPAWQISKVADPTPNVQPGDTMTYTITVTNSGHLTTTGSYTITDEVPANTQFVSASPAPETGGPAFVRWVLNDDLGPNQTVTLSYTVTVDQPLTNAVQIVNQTYSITGGNTYSPAVGAPVTVEVITPVTLTVTKLDALDPVQAGQLIEYTLIVTNDASSKGPAADVVVTDTVPANTSFVDAGFVSGASGTTASAGSGPGSVVTWTLATPNPMNIGDQATLSMTVRVDSPLTNNTVITNEVYGAIVSNDIFTVTGITPITTLVESAPVLSITKEGLPEVVSAGGQLTYTIRYTNSGNANATNVLISDTFPVSTSFQSEDSSPVVAGTPTANGREWNIPFLAGNGGSGLITLTLAISSPQDPGTVLTNVISITSSEVVTPALFTETNLISSTPQLHIRKVAEPSPVASGSTLTYTIIFSNNGNADAIGAIITDMLDSNVTFNGATGGGVHNSGVVTWTGLAVPADGLTQTLEFSVTVAPMLPNNTLLTNNVEIVAGDVRATNTLTTLVQAPALVITKIVSPTGIVRAGDNIEYTVTYTNTGPITITAPGINITDTFPVSITNVVSSTGSSDGTPPIPQATPFVWHDDEVPPDSSATITLTGQVITSPWAASGGEIINDVIVAGMGYSATTGVTSTGQPGLPVVITITASPPSTPVNNNILVTVQAEDTYGNPVLNNTPITLTTTLGTLSSSTINTSNGSATANLFSTVAGTTTLTAQIAGASGTMTATTVATFTPGAVDHFNLVATSPQIAGIGFPITISAVDSFGNVVNTVNQLITISDTTGTIMPTSALLVNGIATPTFTITQATSPAMDTITAISGTITGTVNVVILPNTPTTLNVTVNPTTIRVCQTANVTASITDNFGNPISGRSLSLGTAPPSANLNPPSGVTDNAGIFTSLLTGIAAGSPNPVSVFASSTPLNGSTNLNINGPAVPTNLTLTVSPNPLATGGNTAIATATVTDCLGPSAGQVVTFTVSNPTLAFFSSTPFTATTNASGVATATLTSNSIPQDGTVVVTATVGSLVQTVNVTLQTAALTITKTADPVSGTQVRPGQTINYNLQVTNNGTGPANSITITDVLPAGVSIISCDSVAACFPGSTTTVTTGALAAGQSITATIQVAVTASTTGTVISNQATVRSSQTSLITSNIVAHSVTTATTTLFLPVIFKDFAPAPDLRVRPGSFTVTGGVVTLVVENVGNASTGEGFWVDFYVNPTTLPNNPALGGNRRWELMGSTEGIAWAVPAINAGQSVTLTSNGAAGTIAPAPPPLSNWAGSTNNLFVFVDSFALENVSYVEILESDENNNFDNTPAISSASSSAVEPSSVPDLNNLPPRWKP